MPYVDAESRNRVADSVAVRDVDRLTEGELNYLITSLVSAWLGKEPTYDRFNGVVGVLECAKQELYRRRIAPYEDTKREHHGDVYFAQQGE